MEIHKICRSCKQNKPLSEYYKSKNMKDGTMSTCKKCHCTRTGAYRAANKDRYAKLAREYYAKNGESVREYRRRYYSRDSVREKRNAKHREWMKNNKDHVNEYARRNRWKYRERVNAYNRARRKENPVWYYYTRLLYPVRYVLNKRGKCISRRAEEITGLKAEDLYRHLIGTWRERYGEEWDGQECDIDHIIPVREARTKEDVDRLYHYTNLRLLKPSDNRGK